MMLHFDRIKTVISSAIVQAIYKVLYLDIGILSGFEWCLIVSLVSK